jgi:DNA mismatch repair protein MSH2
VCVLHVTSASNRGGLGREYKNFRTRQVVFFTRAHSTIILQRQGVNIERAIQTNMDESYYASLLESDAKGSDASQESVLLSVIVSRKTQTQQNQANSSVRIAVAARLPRRREHSDDAIRYTIQYFNFLDDSRRFTNLDALLTRLSPVGVVHITSTENGKVTQEKSDDSNNIQLKRARDISKLLEKLAAVINSRSDVASNELDGPIIANIELNMPKNISNAGTLSQQLESNLLPLLGGQSSARYQQYKNDTKLVDDLLTKQAIAFLLLQENIQTQHEDGDHELVRGDLTSHLTMDRTAMECINLLPPRHAGISSVVVGGSESNNSIFGVLNHCKTRMGVRMLEVWLRQPCVDYNTIMYRQNAVHRMVEIDALGRDRLRDEGLGGMRGVDLDSLAYKLSGFSDGSGSTIKALETMYRLHLFADKQLPILMESLVDLANVSEAETKDMNALSSVYEGLAKVASGLEKAVQLVEAVLDFDAAPREFLVKASFSDDLKEIRDELDQIESERQDIHDDMNQKWEEVTGNKGQVRFEESDSNGSSCAWQFRVPDTNAAKTLASDFDVTVHRILKNGVYFSTKDLQQLASKKHDLITDYEKSQREIVKNAMQVAATHVPNLERASELIAELDVLASLAHAAAFNPHGYCRPIITDSEEVGYGLELTQARHPCVELQENVDFIPNDAKLILGESSFKICSGPNAGGKSTYIRSLGAIIVMAQIGSYVPCSSAKINIVHHLLARVGAGDMQDRGISTFMAEMLEASSILRTATKRSMIIIDELGRGTSTFDGYGLAKAISEHIIQKIGCMTVFATHFHELTALEDTEKVVSNCHVTARKATDGTKGLSFLYEVRPGPCFESFGIQVAEMANVPAIVIENAKRKAAELENFDYKKRRSNSGCEKEAAVNFLRKFKSLPLLSFRSNEEKRSAIMELLQH